MKNTETFSKQAIEKAFKEKGIKVPLRDFLKSLRTEEKNILLKKKAVIKKAKPKFLNITIHKDNIFPKIEDNINVLDFLNQVVDDDATFLDMFEDGMPDSGADDIDYFKIGNKVYKAYLHCQPEWCSDWSMRKNIPGSVSVTKIKEIIDFKITKKEKWRLTIKVPNK